MAIIDKSTPLPLYYQIYEDIIKKIRNHELNPGDKLPTEQGLMNMYDVSRVTVRKALEELLSAEIIDRQRGKGATVAFPKISRDVTKLTGLQQQLLKAGMKPSSHIYNIRYIDATPDLMEALHLKKSERLISFGRIRYGDGLPIANQLVYLREKFCPGFDPNTLADKSLYKILEDDYGLKIDYADQSISVKKVAEWEISNLQPADKRGLLFAKLTTYLSTGESVEYTEVEYVPDRYEMSMRLYR